MRSQLYLHSQRRELLKSEISAFNRVFNQRLFPTFENIEEEADKYSERIYEELGQQPGDGSIDMSDIAEFALDKGITFYDELSFVKYSFTAMAIASLYHLWEQQVRKFLYDEMKQSFRINFTGFCKGGIKDIKLHLRSYGIELEKLESWNMLNELRLMCNVIKHGDGKSAKELAQINKSLLVNPRRMFSDSTPLDTTLLEERLNVTLDLFNSYSEKLLQFWDEMPERALLREGNRS